MLIFVWSKMSYSGDMEGCHACAHTDDGQHTECEDRARILETEFLSIRVLGYFSYWHLSQYLNIANSASQNSSSIFTFRCSSFVVCRRPQAWHPLLCPLYDLSDHTNWIFSESLRHPLSNHSPPLTGQPHTNRQIHKYTNTASVKNANIHNMCYIFEKVIVQGPQK